MIQVEAGNWLLLKDASKWARWLAIGGFLLIIGLIYLGARSAYLLIFLPNQPVANRELAASASVISLISSIFLYFPFRWLYRFGSQMKKAGQETNASSLTVALLCLRAFFRYLAIWIFLTIGLYVVFIVVTGIASMLNWGMQ